MFNRLNCLILTLALVGNVFADPNATNPNPENGAIDVYPDVVITWTPGEYVAPYSPGQYGNGHHVFFHSTLGRVQNASLSRSLGNQYGHYRTDTNEFWPLDDPNFGTGSLLKPETTYYWRIAEVNQATTWMGGIWSLTTMPAKATDPVPYNGAVVSIYSGDVLDVELSWTPGTQAEDVNGHDVYFGTSQTAVTDANTLNGLGVYMGRQSDAFYDLTDLPLDVNYYWRIDEINNVYGLTKGDVWGFVTDSGLARNPVPSNGQTIVNPDLPLTWTASRLAASHNIYFGTDSEALPAVETGYLTTSYAPAMDLNTTYYWRIDEVNALHPKSPWVGNLWSFTTDTGKARNPSPGNGQTGLYLLTQLGWTAAARAVSHDVSFGTDSPPPFIVNQTATSFNPNRLSYGTTYYWRIDEVQADEEKTTGDEWSFTTAAGPVDVNVDVDQTVQYQTIDGFGAHGARKSWWDPPPLYDQNFLDTVIDDLGLTITRNEYYPPGDGDCNFAKQTPFLQAMKAKAESSGEPLKFIATYWTPPAAWKDPPGLHGGSLLPEYYDEFGGYAVDTIQAYKNIGIDLYALSLQNEPGYNEPYNSCYYTYPQYRDMLKVVGPIVDANWPNTKLFMAEHMLAYQKSENNYENYIINDPDALQWADIWAVHGYGGRDIPYPSSEQALEWSLAWNRFQPTGRHFWMTETSGYNESWAQSRQLAQAIFAGLKYGHISAWLWWQLSENNGYGNPPGEYVLMNLGVPGKRYYISKHYYRYIRPEAVMVEGNADNNDLLIVAFKHPVQRTTTIVLINASETTEKLVQLNITGNPIPPEFHIYRTTATENCIDAGIVTSNGTFVMPESSVVTLYGTLPHYNFIDYTGFADQWLQTGCDAGNDWCNGADLTQDGSVLLDDLKSFTENWL